MNWLVSFFDGFITALPQQQLQVLANPQAALTMTGTATPEDVLTGKTFYSTNPGTIQTGTLVQSGGGYLYIDRPVVKEVIVEKENPVNIDLLKLTTNLLKQKQILKHKIIERKLET